MSQSSARRGRVSRASATLAPITDTPAIEIEDQRGDDTPLAHGCITTA